MVTIYQTYKDFLSGQKLSTSQRFHDLSLPSVERRIEYLKRRCAGKKVLHIGCLDHSEIILERVQKGTWLHGIISEVSELCLGIDINLSGYNIVRNKLGIENVQLLDLAKPVTNPELSLLGRTPWDLIICAEVLEHITNHQQFLHNLSSFASYNTILVITGPNAFRFTNFINTVRCFEEVNSDHKYWFTFYTLSRLLTANGWEPSQLIYYDVPKEKIWLRFLCKLATRISRTFSDGLIVEAIQTRETYSDKY